MYIVCRWGDIDGGRDIKVEMEIDTEISIDLDRACQMFVPSSWMSPCCLDCGVGCLIDARFAK